MSKAALDKARSDLRGQGLEMAKDPNIESKDGASAATLQFPRPQPDYALKAQVERLVSDELDKLGIHKFQLNGVAERPDPTGRFSQMVLTLGDKSSADDPTKDAIPVEDFKTALSAVQTQFSSKPQPERLENFDSQLAADTQQRALYAILASWVAILCTCGSASAAGRSAWRRCSA